MVAAVSWATPALAVTFTPGPGSYVPAYYQRWAERSRVPTIPGPVELALGACPTERHAAGCTRPETRVIYLDPRLGDWRDRQLVLLHELGHRWDYEVLDRAGHSRFLAFVGRRPPWRQRGENSPHEEFADAYAECALGLRPDVGLWLFGPYQPTLREHRRVCAWLRLQGRPDSAGWGSAAR